MTERLYYKDPTLLEFDAQITATGKYQDKFYVILDKTAFYPTAGGQPRDFGVLNDLNVIDVIEDDIGNIRHITTAQVGGIGTKVHGGVDADRRSHFRQLHTAQHILSRSFINLFNYETVSVHLGEEYGAVELGTESVLVEQCHQAEKMSNQLIQQNRTIDIIFVDEKAAATLPLRKKPERSGIIRVIKIGDFDWSACGGTHCKATSEVGLIKVLGVEKLRGHALVKFLAGTRAREDYDARFVMTDLLTKSLTCSVADLPGRIEKLSEENKQFRRQLNLLQQQLLPIKVATLVEKAVPTGKFTIVCEEVQDIDSKMLSQLAGEVATKSSGIVILLLEDRICLAAAESINLNAGEIVKRMAAKLNLKGGGSKQIAQLGGVNSRDLPKYKEVLISVLNEM